MKKIKAIEVKHVSPNSISPYENNPRLNDLAVEKVAESIQKFGFKQPIVVDQENIIIVGHTRWRAAKKLGLKRIPVIVAIDLTDDEAKEYRIADNRTHDFAEWDWVKVGAEVIDLKDKGRDVEWLEMLNLGEEEKVEIVNDPDDEWVGMPEFEEREQTYRLIIHFETMEARDEFEKKYQIEIMKKGEHTWSTWYPYKERHDATAIKFE